MAETAFTQDRGGTLLVTGLTPGMEECHRGSFDSRLANSPGCVAQPRLVEFPDDTAARVDALVNLDHLRVDRLRQQDREGEDVRSLLGTDVQEIGEAPGNDEDHGVRPPLKEGIGATRGSKSKLHVRHRHGSRGPRRQADTEHGGRLTGHHVHDVARHKPMPLIDLEYAARIVRLEDVDTMVVTEPPDHETVEGHSRLQRLKQPQRVSIDRFDDTSNRPAAEHLAGVVSARFIPYHDVGKGPPRINGDDQWTRVGVPGFNHRECQGIAKRGPARSRGRTVRRVPAGAASGARGHRRRPRWSRRRTRQRS